MARLTERGARGRRRRLHARRARSCTARSTASCPAPTRRPTSCSRIGDAVGDAGHGVFQLVSDDQGARRRGRRVAGRARPPHRRAPSPTRWRSRRYAPDGVPRRARRRRRAHEADGLHDRPAGAVPADRDAVRAAVVAAPVHHPPDLPRDRRRCRSPSAWRGCAQPEVRAALLAEEPQTGNPIARVPDVALGPDLPARRPARLRAGAARRASPPWPSARVAAPRRSCSTGCSSATARRCCSPRSPATSTTTTRRSAR